MKYPLRVVSVERSLFEGDVEFMIAKGADGELGVLARHAPLMTILDSGVRSASSVLPRPHATTRPARLSQKAGDPFRMSR